MCFLNFLYISNISLDLFIFHIIPFKPLYIKAFRTYFIKNPYFKPFSTSLSLYIILKSNESRISTVLIIHIERIIYIICIFNVYNYRNLIHCSLYQYQFHIIKVSEFELLLNFMSIKIQ